MTEFKRAGDVMVFECDAFKIQVIGDSQTIKLSDAVLRSGTKPVGILENAFKVLGMMLELENKHDGNKKVTEMNFKINVDTKDAEEAIRQLNEVASGEGVPSRPFIKLEGI